MFMINDMTDNFIPADQRSEFLADGSYYLALAILRFVQAGGTPPEEKQKAGEEAITLARKALELHTHLFGGTEHHKVAMDMGALAVILDYFNDVDSDEVLRLIEQAIPIFRRVEGALSLNVAVDECKLSSAYMNRANRAQAVNDVNREMANLELVMIHLVEAVRIFRANNLMDRADECHGRIAVAEGKLQRA